MVSLQFSIKQEPSWCSLIHFPERLDTVRSAQFDREETSDLHVQDYSKIYLRHISGHHRRIRTSCGRSLDCNCCGGDSHRIEIATTLSWTQKSKSVVSGVT